MSISHVECKYDEREWATAVLNFKIVVAQKYVKLHCLYCNAQSMQYLYPPAVFKLQNNFKMAAWLRTDTFPGIDDGMMMLRGSWLLAEHMIDI